MAPHLAKGVSVGSKQEEAEASVTSESQGLLAQLPKLPGERRAAELQERMRNLSQSALGSRALERPARVANVSALSELQASARADAPEPSAA